MSTFEAAGIEITAGHGAGPGVRVKEALNSLEEFLSFLRLYEHTRLRAKARFVAGTYEFGFVFVYHNREGADLMYRGERWGTVRWREGQIKFDPEPSSEGMAISLSDEVFNAWVARADYRRTTRT